MNLQPRRRRRQRQQPRDGVYPLNGKFETTANSQRGFHVTAARYDNDTGAPEFSQLQEEFRVKR